MTTKSEHTFHIPVMGLAYTIDTPVKVARFGISSVISIIQDVLIEQMREFYCKARGEKYEHISEKDIDHRAKRITSYLNLVQLIVQQQVEEMKKEPFEEGKDIVKYFQLLPENSPVKHIFSEMTQMQGEAKAFLQRQLRNSIVPGSIDVNIMTKIDNLNYAETGDVLPQEYSDAVAALRGFANSTLSSSVVFSAGLNPRLFGFLESCADFYPDANGNLRKKIILKVSDYRSAIIQGKYLAKKGLWISEFRIESGLNCGGHAFPTEGYLLGPILEEFKCRKKELIAELFTLCNASLISKKKNQLPEMADIRITAQGGIGTSEEDKFLREYYNLDATGWGSPFLLVPEVTNVDDVTLQRMVHASKEDYYVSHASPLGIPFNNFRRTTSEEQRKSRIEKNRPGSPCYKKYLAFNTEFTDKPICTASREYQNFKLKELERAKETMTPDDFKRQYDDVIEKDCLCEGLSTTALLKNHIPVEHKLDAVTICPGPNLAYFSSVFSLEQMVGHIYGRQNILNSRDRSHAFVNELKMYVDYLRAEIEKNLSSLSDKHAKYFASFKANLLQGIEYYKQILPNMKYEAEELRAKMREEMESLRKAIAGVNCGVV